LFISLLFQAGRTMESEDAATKRARARGGGGRSAGDADRLSALPDSLLHAIMSFLKARQAVQTCVLATRWRHLWRSVPCLDVDYDEFCRTVAAAPAASSKDRAKQEWEDFEDFTNNLMHRCNVALLKSSSLRVTHSRAPGFRPHKQTGGWLRDAMKYCTPDLPRQRTDGGLSSSSWRLKRLQLCNVALDARFGNHVRLACSSLKDLELEDCMCAFQAITSGSMKSLVLKNCWWNSLTEITSPSLKRLVVAGASNDDAPCVVVALAIAHLCLDVPLYFARSISVNRMPSLPRL
jgi:hypothetical protein